MSNSSFLPDDYLEQKADRRTNVISLTLFTIVMLGVFLAFLFTNQKWAEVKNEQGRINAEYQTAAQQIQEVMELETQKEEMLQKAELAATLVERVPRSVLLAELINRMPPRLSILEFELKSEQIKAVAPREDKDKDKDKRLGPKRPATKEQATATETKKVRPPRYAVSVSLVGVAPSGLEVSRYLAELNGYPLLREVTLEYSEEKDIEGQTLQQFAIKMQLAEDADVRNIEPLTVPRDLVDPMSDELRLRAADLPFKDNAAASAFPVTNEGD
jgi:Tfp pilus assembly protein PilN